MTPRCSAAVLTIALLAVAPVEAKTTCSGFFADGANSEDKIALATGRAALYRGHAEFGIARATLCLFSVFDPGGPNYGLGPGASITNALLALLIIDPATWLATTSNVNPEYIDAWLKKPIRLAQLQPLGECPRPDRFEVALRALTQLQPTNTAQERLRSRLAVVLLSLHCEVAR